ncbi:MAG: hypothetical protein DRP97_00505 [Candidatus Latescibacterota bacterium]|nr:MAG: hypothetical protein DRP97_00505 [Candidatus Latescibacterota bacterium]
MPKKTVGRPKGSKNKKKSEKMPKVLEGILPMANLIAIKIIRDSMRRMRIAIWALVVGFSILTIELILLIQANPSLL